MGLFPKTLLICLALTLANGAPMPPQDATGTDGDAALPDRCKGIEFDAITPDVKGNTLFFKDAYFWNSYHGPAQLISNVYKELTDNPAIGYVDAAFRMHIKDDPSTHDSTYFFLDDQVFSYNNRTLKTGYPKHMHEEFPGVPTHLDSAVECPKGECIVDSVLFFKGHDVHIYDLSTKTVKTKTWHHLPVCTSTFRWLEHYYCFHGHNFTRFNPVSGEVNGTYPKDARNYFMRCPNFGHGAGYKPPKCSEVKIDAITTDDTGKTYFFAGPIYMRLDTSRDGLHAFPITRLWKEVTRVDAVFSYADKMYLIQADQVYIYKAGVHYTLVEGYPKSLKEELGIEGQVNAAFVCPNEHTVHVIQGNSILDIDLTATPRAITQSLSFSLSGIDAAHCGKQGIDVFIGSKYYNFQTIADMATATIATPGQPITSEMMGCQD